LNTARHRLIEYPTRPALESRNEEGIEVRQSDQRLSPVQQLDVHRQLVAPIAVVMQVLSKDIRSHKSLQ